MKEEKINYGFISFIIIVIFLVVWILIHFVHISNVQISSGTMYDCPGVGLQDKIGDYIGCEFIKLTEQNIRIKERICIFYD